MTNKAEDEVDESIKIGPGDLLSFGNINLLLTLNLTKQDLSKYKVEWDNLESLKDLKFIRKHKHFWKRIELSSNDNTMNILLHINRTSKKLVKIGYVGLKKMEFKDKQKNFQDFIISVTKQNGLYITSCDVCKCTISIQLLLKYENEEKIFLLSGKSTDIKKPQGNETHKDDKDENININDIKENKEYEEDKINENEKKNNEDENKNNLKPNENNENKENKENEEKKENKDPKNNEDNSNSNENKEEISELNREGKTNNPFVNIVNNNINVGDFNYIYFNFNDYIYGEFKGKIKIEHLFEYFQDIKIRTKSKIILNFEDEAEVFRNQNKDEIFKDLLSITDIFIFYNKNKLYDVLKDLKEEEDQEQIDESLRLFYFESQRKYIEKEKLKQKEEEITNNYKLFLEKSRNDKEKNIPKHLTTEGNATNNPNIYITQEKKDEDKNLDSHKNNQNNNNNNMNNHLETSESKKDLNVNQLKAETENNHDNYRDKICHKSMSENKKNKLMPLYIKPSPPKPLSKSDMFNYFKNGIFSRDPQRPPTEKIVLVLDEFNKIFIVKCNKFEEKPFVLDFDLKLYPQVNIRNLNDILNYKKFIKSKFIDYVNIFFGCFLGVITGKGKQGCDEGSLFLGYLLSTNIIKKLAEIQRYNLPLPKTKEFFYPSINKTELKKLMEEAEKRKKEKLFVLDGNKKENLIIKPYNPLLDKNLYSYLNNKNNKNYLKKKGFIGKNGNIMYDPLYRDTLGFNDMIKKRNVLNSLQNIKLLNVEPKDKRINSPSPTNKFLVGYRIKSPGYSVYYQRQKKNNVYLPPINQKRPPVIEKNNKKDIIEENSEEGASNEGSKSGSGEVSETGSGDGSGNNEDE